MVVALAQERVRLRGRDDGAARREDARPGARRGARAAPRARAAGTSASPCISKIVAEGHPRLARDERVELEKGTPRRRATAAPDGALARAAQPEQRHHAGRRAAASAGAALVEELGRARAERLGHVVEARDRDVPVARPRAARGTARSRRPASPSARIVSREVACGARGRAAPERPGGASRAAGALFALVHYSSCPAEWQHYTTCSRPCLALTFEPSHGRRTSRHAAASHPRPLRDPPRPLPALAARASGRVRRRSRAS